MIADTLGLVARTTSCAARRLPVAGRLFGRVPRLKLEGRVVFITGAARGLGAEIARQAYDHWRAHPGAEAFAVYRAATDREDAAAAGLMHGSRPAA